MSRRVTNFDYEIYSPESGFQSVHARTLPGRTLGCPGDWCEGSWPRLHHTFNSHPHTLGAHGWHPAHFFHPPAALRHGGGHGTIMGGFFDAPAPAEIKTFSDRQVVTVRSSLFREVKPSVQVKGSQLKVFAARIKTGTDKHGTVKRDDEFEYVTTLSGAFDARKMTASRNGDTLTITLGSPRIVGCHALSPARRLHALAAVYSETGDPAQVLRAAHVSVPPQGLGATGVLVEMLAAPVNPSDLNQIEGTYPVKGTFSTLQLDADGVRQAVAVGGNEGVGRVVETGSGVGDLRVGDWVVPRRAGEFGTWATHVAADRTQLALVPRAWHDGLDPLHVAMLKVNPSTAYRMLRDFVALRDGDWVVQNGANSGVGRSVIQLARPLGVRTINVVRDRGADEFDALAAELRALGADIVVRDTEIMGASSAELKRRMGLGQDASVRLGLNCVGGRATLAMTKLLTQGAILVSYGGMSRQPVTLPTSLLLFKDICARGFWMNRWYQDPRHGAATEEMWRAILDLARDGRFEHQPVRRVPWAANMHPSDAASALHAAVGWAAGPKHAFVFGAQK
ncbi:mitochondrial 2-enoyl thioester reductase [Coemansia sp. Benny D115]|nr:mitochondrial 2-enoyl thioester reductase [Coemansia sp. Benny D115]